MLCCLRLVRKLLISLALAFDMVGFYIAVEDDLSEAVARKLLSLVFEDFCVYGVLKRGGNGYLRQNLRAFCELARNIPVLLLTDLDQRECAPSLKEDWFSRDEQPENLVFRVCEREVEAWLLADQDGLRALLGGRIGRIHQDPDGLEDPKRELLSLAKRARSHIQSDLLPERGSTATVGLGYNSVLSEFVSGQWSAERARERSDSLARAITSLENLRDRLQ